MTELPIQYQELENIYANTCGRGIRTLAVCSAEPGEGVSTIAYALARRSEAGGHKTLLVELNLYNPQLATRAGQPRQTWSDHGTPHFIPRDSTAGKLALLPAPPASQALLALGERDTIAAHIQHWRTEFDTVILDTSPVNCVNRGNIPADTVCASCDGTILVVLAGKTRSMAIKRACETLAGAGARLVGTVLNDRFNPSLARELRRETARFDSKWPRTMAAMRDLIRRCALLNLQI